MTDVQCRIEHVVQRHLPNLLPDSCQFTKIIGDTRAKFPGSNELKTMYIDRIIDIFEKSKTKSILLLGARQTGKTSLILHSLPKDTPQFSLLDKEFFFRVTSNLSLIRQRLGSNPPPHNLVVIDEIQKLPELLDEVHLMIEKNGYRFILTGSSTRKIKGPGVNSLGGRARELIFHPLVQHELQMDFDLRKALNRGLIPSIYLSDDPLADQRAYVGSYLEVEIASEAAVRDLPAFSRFLSIAAQCNGQIINYSAIGNDAQVNRKVVAEYFQILFDTLIAWEVPAWKHAINRKLIETSKFYFFDTGIVRAILDLPPIKEKSKEFGDFFEAYIFHELRTYIDYCRPGLSLHFWRSTSQHEVDFILGGKIAIEVKGKVQVSQSDLRGLRVCAEESLMENYIVVSLEPVSRIVENRFHIMPFEEFLQKLWNHEIIAMPESI